MRERAKITEHEHEHHQQVISISRKFSFSSVLRCMIECKFAVCRHFTHFFNGISTNNQKCHKIFTFTTMRAKHRTEDEFNLKKKIVVMAFFAQQKRAKNWEKHCKNT
jgi:hypothetical protein